MSLLIYVHYLYRNCVYLKTFRTPNLFDYFTESSCFMTILLDIYSNNVNLLQRLMI